MVCSDQKDDLDMSAVGRMLLLWNYYVPVYKMQGNVDNQNKATRMQTEMEMIC